MFRRSLLPLLLAVALPVAAQDAPPAAAPKPVAPTPAGVRVDAFTPQGSVKNIRQVSVRFSQAVVRLGDPRALEPFAVECAVAGKGRWLDTRSWVYEFAEEPPAGLRCAFRVKSELKAVGGAKLAAATFSFDTGAPMLRASLPRDRAEDIDENQVFLLLPDAKLDPRAVAEHVWCGVAGLEERIGVDVLQDSPRHQVIAQGRALGHAWRELLAAAGHGEDKAALERAEASLIAVRCRRALPAQAEVRLVWGRGLALNGLARTEDHVLSFKTRPAFTARFECERVAADAACLPFRDMRLSFSAPVPRAQAGQVRLQTPEGALEPRLPEGGGPFVEDLRFVAPFPEQKEFKIELPPDLRDDAGRPLQNAARFPLTVKTDEFPPLVKFGAEFGILEWKEGGVLPVTLRNTEQFLSARALSHADRHAVEGRTRRFDTDAEVMDWYRRVHKAAERRGEMRKGRDGNDVWIEQTGDKSLLLELPAVRSFTLAKPSGARPLELVGIPLTTPGFHVVELASPRLGAALLGPGRIRYVATSALVTNMSVHIKWGRENSLVWVTTLDAAAPVKGARVQISDYCRGTTLWNGTTDASGLARIPAGSLPPPTTSEYCHEGSPGPLFVSARNGEDLSFVLSSWNRGIQPWNFGLQTAFFGVKTIVHTVFDRTLLRAGETVHMKHFVRRGGGAGFSAPPEPPSEIEIEHEGSGQKYRIESQFDAAVSAVNEWTIPAGARQGRYTVRMKPGGELYARASGEFRVEQFRLPALRAAVAAPGAPAVAPRDLDLEVSVQYLNGGGAERLPVKLRSQTRERYVAFPGYPDFLFGGRALREGIQEPEAEEAFEETTELPLARGAGKVQVLPLVLDEHGSARTRLPNLPVIEKPMELLAELEYPDPSGELLTTSNRIPLWPSARVLGIRTERWMANRERVRSEIVVLDLQGKPAAGQELEVDVFQRRTYSYRKRLIGGFYAYEHQAEIRRVGPACKGKSDKQGRLECVFKPSVEGELLLQARVLDEQQRPAYAVGEVWVSGDEEAWFAGGQADRMDVLPEQREYQAGDTARLQVRMPFRNATALVTLEREGVLDAMVMVLRGRQPVVEFKVADHYSPNVFASVLAVRGRVKTDDSWLGRMTRAAGMGEAETAPTARLDLARPAYRLGIAELRTGWKPHRLEVRVQPERETYAVRQRARVKVQVRGSDGKPPPPGAEIAFAAVDEALLELMPNESWKLLDRMMDPRNLSVLTATAQMQVVGKRHYGRKAVPPGGGGGRQGARELFDTLLLWRGRALLDAQGEATIEVPLNDSLSAFRLVAVAHAGAGAFGTGSATVRTTQNLLLYSGLPPVVRSGDRYEAQFTVRNTTSNEQLLSVSARVVPEGAPDFDLPVQPFRLRAGGTQIVRFPVDVPVTARSLAYEVTAASADGRLRDSLRAVQPVLPAVPERVVQATLMQWEKPTALPVAMPPGAAVDRGGISVSLRASLAEGLDGVRDYLARYPYTCLEQKFSQAVALRDRARFDALMRELPAYLDADGLARYFPGEIAPGSDTLTAYLLSLAHEAGWEIPSESEQRLRHGLTRFVQGKLVRTSALPAADLAIRRLAALEALSRLGAATPAMLGAIAPDLQRWPTSALLDWIGVHKRLANAPQRQARIEDGLRILRARMTLAGTILGFTGERTDALPWLMISSDVNANRALLLLLDEPAWKEELPRLWRGALGRQRNGRWDTTTANAWGVLATEKFGRAFESAPLTGRTRVELAGYVQQKHWSDPASAATLNFSWPATPSKLLMDHAGNGHPWVQVQVRAAVPLARPLAAGFGVTREVVGIEKRRDEAWSRGDVARVRLEIDASADMSWVVVDDPIPAGAAILGTGLGRDSALLSAKAWQPDSAWPAYEERRFDGYRAYFRYLPKGRHVVEYTVRLNNAGRFRLPETRVEAMYAPEMFGALPNVALEVRE